jgi:Uma2 family endonuclease
MAIRTKFGPADHGRPLALADFMAADYLEGYRYELIDEKLYVSPRMELPQARVADWLLFKLLVYVRANPHSVNYVLPHARIFVPERSAGTNAEANVAAYCDFPLHLPLNDLHWQDVSPALVAEVLCLEDPDKELVRNVELYLQVPSIREYWLFDTRAEGADQPTLRVRRRWGSRWRVIDLDYGETYTTKLLPGFELIVNPRR